MYALRREAEHRRWQEEANSEDEAERLSVPKALDILEERLAMDGLLRAQSSTDDFTKVMGAQMWTRFLLHHFRFADAWAMVFERLCSQIW